MSDDKKTRGIVFADIVGSTRLFERHGDADAHRVIDHALGLLSDVTKQHAGTVVKTIGDEVMSSFEDVRNAFIAVTDMQRAIASDRELSESNVRIRIGLQAGDVVLSDGDVFGDTVNVASRLANLASAGQILTTRESWAMLTNESLLTVRDLGPGRVRGRSRPLELVELIWRPDSGIATVRNVDVFRPADHGVLTLEYLGEQIAVEADQVPFVLGRAGECDLVVRHHAVSREHARIDVGNNRFVLVDRSTNATFVLNDESRGAIRVHREQAPLHGRGIIGLGVDPWEAGEKDGDALVRFSCAG